MSSYGRSLSRVIDFLGEIWTTSKAYNCKFVNNDMYFHNELIGSYDWEDNTDVPIFYFKQELESLNEKQYNNRELLIEIFGYIELDKNDSNLGTTGLYNKKIKGYI